MYLFFFFPRLTLNLFRTATVDLNKEITLNGSCHLDQKELNEPILTLFLILYRYEWIP
jgi:hypothetical protein